MALWASLAMDDNHAHLSHSFTKHTPDSECQEHNNSQIRTKRTWDIGPMGISQGSDTFRLITSSLLVLPLPLSDGTDGFPVSYSDPMCLVGTLLISPQKTLDTMLKTHKQHCYYTRPRSFAQGNVLKDFTTCQLKLATKMHFLLYF